MHSSRVSTFAFLFSGLLISACTVTTNQVADAGSGVGASPDGGVVPGPGTSMPDGAAPVEASVGASDAGMTMPDGTAMPDVVAPQGDAAVVGFNASALDLSWVDTSKLVDDIILSDPNCSVYSETQIWACADTGQMQHKIITRSDQSRVSVFVMKSLRVEASALMRTEEHLPVVLVTLGDMTILGSIIVTPGTAGGAYDTVEKMKGSGPGGGGVGTANASGGGGSFCGVGGMGSTTGTPASAKSTAYGNAMLNPIVGGSAGGSADLNNDVGAGGGAIQLVARGTLLLGPQGYISAPGGGGIFGTIAGGGGSGGAILIEAPTVTINGELAANGGGGGQGSVGDTGEDGHTGLTAALGGHKMFDNGVLSPGGNAGAGASTDGAAGSSTTTSTAGGGGGGVGRIRINTRSGMATIAGSISPAFATTCASQGTIQ